MEGPAVVANNSTTAADRELVPQVRVRRLDANLGLHDDPSPWHHRPQQTRTDAALQSRRFPLIANGVNQAASGAERSRAHCIIGVPPVFPICATVCLPGVGIKNRVVGIARERLALQPRRPTEHRALSQKK